MCVYIYTYTIYTYICTDTCIDMFTFKCHGTKCIRTKTI